MLNWLREEIKKWTIPASLDLQTRRLSFKIDSLRAESKQLQKRIDVRRQQIDSEAKMAVDLLEESKLLQQKMDFALEAAREKLKIAEEIVIPGLVSANKTFEASRDYQTATMAMRKGAVEQTEEEPL